MTSFIDSLPTWGHFDIKKTDEYIEKYNLDPDDFADKILEEAETHQVRILDIDPVATVLEFILSRVREEIEEKTGKDIHDTRDCPDWVEVNANYLCSFYDGTDGAFKCVQALIEQIDEPERSDLLQTFYHAVILNR